MSQLICLGLFFNLGFNCFFIKQKEKERNSQDASTKTPPKQPITGIQQPVVQGHTQTEISNRFQNLSMEYMPIYQPIPPYYNFPPIMYHPNYPMYYANPQVPVRFVHPSGIPVPRHIPIGLPLSQPSEASNMTNKDGLDLHIGLPPQATGASDLTGHGVIHVK